MGEVSPLIKKKVLNYIVWSEKRLTRKLNLEIIDMQCRFTYYSYMPNTGII